MFGSTAYQGAAVGPLEVPLDGAVVEADPLVLAVLFWGQRRAWGAPPSPGSRQGGGIGGGGSPEEGSRAPVSPRLSLMSPCLFLLLLDHPAS